MLREALTKLEEMAVQAHDAKVLPNTCLILRGNPADAARWSRAK